MPYTLFYISEDVAHRPEGIMPLGTWSVYSEMYESIEDTDPIEDSTVHVSGNLTEQEAHNMATARQRASYALKKENDNG